MTLRRKRPARRTVSIVTGIRIPHDAISKIVAQQYQVLTDAGYDCCVFVHYSAFGNVREDNGELEAGQPLSGEPAVDDRIDDPQVDLGDGGIDSADEVMVGDSWQLSKNDRYLDSDVVILHFGIHYDLFNSLLIPHPKAKRVVHFHNVTPPELLSGYTQRAAFGGLAQLSIADRADAVWSDSPHNTESLFEHTSVDPSLVKPMELCVPEMDDVVAAASRPHPHAPVILLAVGRFVEAKGQLDLVRAIAGLGFDTRWRVCCVLAGSPENSDAAYLRRVHEFVASAGLADLVEFRFDLLDDELVDLFVEADVFVSPSYHEGFCVPVVEALASGCRVIATNAGALVDTVGGHGRHVVPGDVDVLSDVLAEEIALVLAAREPGSAAQANDRERRASARRYVGIFGPDAFAHRTLSAVEALLG